MKKNIEQNRMACLVTKRLYFVKANRTYFKLDCPNSLLVSDLVVTLFWVKRTAKLVAKNLQI